MRGNNYGIIVLSNSRIIQLYSRKDEIKQANKNCAMARYITNATLIIFRISDIKCHMPHMCVMYIVLCVWLSLLLICR